MPHEQAPDQRYDNSLSLTFDSEPLAEPLEILGNGQLRIKVAADKPLAQLAVRLSDVRPDGSVTKMAMGFLNLAHRDGSEFPEPLKPGAFYDVSVQLSAVGYRLPAGHRIRISLSPSYWPVVWPSPEPVKLKVRDAGTLDLAGALGGEDGNVSFLPREIAGPCRDGQHSPRPRVPALDRLRPGQQQGNPQACRNWRLWRRRG